jgi:superfamily I DNA and RNA helicase
VAGDGRTAQLDGGRPAVELRDAETPDFLLVGCFKREHEILLVVDQLSHFIVS